MSRKRTLTDLGEEAKDENATNQLEPLDEKTQQFAAGGEVLLFQSPKDDSNLFVSRLHKDTTQQELYELFRPFGLIYDLTLYEVAEEEKPWNYAFVKYYSCWAAYRALNALHRHKFHDVACKVMFARKKNNQFNSTPFQLPIQRCLELSNHYLGFDGWSSGIVALAEAEPLTLDRASNMYKSVYRCVVRFTFKRDKRELEAIGFGKEEGNKRGTVIEFAKKKAVTEAYKNAFASIALILLRSGKVAIHFLDTPIDQWDPYTPAGDDNQRVRDDANETSTVKLVP